VGASGAISGVLGFYFLWFPRNTVRLFVFLFPFFMNVVEIPARIVLAIYLVIDNLLPLFLSAGETGGGVAHGAHIGGFIAGLFGAWYGKARELREQPAEYRTASTPPRLIETIPNLIEQSSFEEAARTYFALDASQTRQLLSPRHSLALADWLATHGHASAALTLYRRHVRDYPAGPGRAEAHLGAGLILLEAGQATPAYQHFLESIEADPMGPAAARARAALQSIAERQKFQMRNWNQ
jgi:hypothetical protein